MGRVNNWESFAEGDLLNILEKFDLQSITVSDGNRKATIKVNRDGEIKVNTSSTKTL